MLDSSSVKSRLRALPILLLGLALAAAPVDGQIFRPAPVDEAALAVEVQKPVIPDAVGLAGYSTVWEADAIFPLSGGTSVRVGIPLALAGADYVDGTSFYLGNLRASLLFGEPGEATGYLGVVVPTASNIGGPDLAVAVGALPWLDELEKWSTDAFALRGGWIPAWEVGSAGGRVGLQVGGAAVTPNDFENLYVFSRITPWIAVPLGSAVGRAELETSYDITGDDGFGQQFMSYLDLGVTLAETTTTPTLFLRVPLDDDARSVLDLSFGVGLVF